MYFVSRRKHHDRGGIATTVGTVSAVGAAISVSSVLLDPPWSYLVFYGGIVFDMAALVLLNRRLQFVPALPELRPYLLTNTAAVFALTALVLMLPLGLEAMLVGMTATMICYVLLNLRYRHLMRAAQVPTWVAACAAPPACRASGKEADLSRLLCDVVQVRSVAAAWPRAVQVPPKRREKAPQQRLG